MLWDSVATDIDPSAADSGFKGRVVLRTPFTISILNIEIFIHNIWFNQFRMITFWIVGTRQEKFAFFTLP